MAPEWGSSVPTVSRVSSTLKNSERTIRAHTAALFVIDHHVARGATVGSDGGVPEATDRAKRLCGREAEAGHAADGNGCREEGASLDFHSSASG